jgi:hypothetical protein
MQQRQTTTSPFATKTAEAAVRSSVKTAPIVLDAAALKLVAGGVAATGPNGGWATAVVTGPNGGW